MIIIFDDADQTARELDALTESRLRKIAKEAEVPVVLVAAAIIHDVGEDDERAHVTSVH